MQIQREKLSSFRKRWFFGNKPTAKELKELIDSDRLSGEVLAGEYYVLVNHHGDPMWYGEKPKPITVPDEFTANLLKGYHESSKHVHSARR